MIAIAAQNGFLSYTGMRDKESCNQAAEYADILFGVLCFCCQTAAAVSQGLRSRNRVVAYG